MVYKIWIGKLTTNYTQLVGANAIIKLHIIKYFIINYFLDIILVK